MKLIISTILLSIIVVSLYIVTGALSQAFGEEPPAFLKDAEIVVNLKDGNKAKFSANDWKVVPRIDKVKKSSRSLEITVLDKKNRVTILGGVGPEGYHYSQSSKEVTISNRRKVVYGLGYQRKISDRFSLGGQVITNGTYTLDLGLDF